MPGPIGTALGYVSRLLPQKQPDVGYRELRIGSYGEQVTQLLGMTKHGYCEEGTYFVAADTAGRATAAAPTSFSDTAPLLAILNTDAVGGKTLDIDYIRATETAAGTAGVSVFMKVQLDTIGRYSSGGTTVTPINSNGGASQKSIGQMIVLPTLTVNTPSVRQLTQNSCVLPTVTAPIGIGSEWCAYFGGDGAKFFAVSATLGWAGSSYEPLVIPPQWLAVIEFLITSQSAASSWQIEYGGWER
jgi:hypothetical protein